MNLLMNRKSRLDQSHTEEHTGANGDLTTYFGAGVKSTGSKAYFFGSVCGRFFDEFKFSIFFKDSILISQPFQRKWVVSFLRTESRVTPDNVVTKRVGMSAHTTRPPTNGATPFLCCGPVQTVFVTNIRIGAFPLALCHCCGCCCCC